MLESLRERGVPIETLFLQLMAPAARLLGEYWVEDVCDFTEVTVALGRLQRMLNVLSPLLEHRLQPDSNGLSILLLTAPGEQHTLGLAMVGEFFRRSGWEVCGGPSTGTAQAVGLFKRRSFDAVGFSLAGVGHVDALAQSISAVRMVAGSRPLCIIVGGPVFDSHPEYVSKVGADLVATDAKEAPDLVRHFVKANRADSELLRCSAL
jgi:methanogenic corrinoid protein MtbC1